MQIDNPHSRKVKNSNQVPMMKDDEDEEDETGSSFINSFPSKGNLTED